MELGGFGKLLGLEKISLGVSAEIGVGVLDAEGVDVVLMGIFGVEDETAELDIVTGTEVSEKMAGHFSEVGRRFCSGRAGGVRVGRRKSPRRERRGWSCGFWRQRVGKYL